MPDKLQITNKTRNPYTVPLAKGGIKTADHTIQPGGTGLISVDAHTVAMKSNQAYRALVETKKLVVASTSEQTQEVHEEELENTADPEKPADLDEAPAAEGAENAIEASVESKGVEMVEAPVEPAAPTKAPAKAKSKAKSK